ncbi:hypothetical protein D1872_274310 [compost metagenome]
MIIKRYGRQAYAVNGDAVPQFQPFSDDPGRNMQYECLPLAANRFHRPDLLDKSCKHRLPPLRLRISLDVCLHFLRPNRLSLNTDIVSDRLDFHTCQRDGLAHFLISRKNKAPRRFHPADQFRGDKQDDLIHQPLFQQRAV